VISVAQSLHSASAVPGRPRVIVALPDPLEGATVVDWLKANNFDPVYRTNPAHAAAEMQRPFDLLIADAMWAVGTALQSGARARNPLVPAILIGEAVERRSTAVNAQTMYMSRPIEKPVFACFVAMALINEDEKPVRRSPRKTVQRFEALVNGIPSGIINVSPEGMRVEMPRDQRSALPPYFAVRVPLVGVAVIAKRRWMMPATKSAGTLWCGAALSHNRASSEERWRNFVDSVPIIGDGTMRVSA
jgi:hypothetical protein